MVKIRKSLRVFRFSNDIRQGLNPYYAKYYIMHKDTEIVEVAFQGERGAYGEAAAFLFFEKEIRVRPFEKLSEVFDAVEEGQTDFGIVPVENSLAGSVGETYDLLLDSRLKVCGEIDFEIVHCLIVHPGAVLSEIETIYSHPQTLVQCRKFLESLECELVPTHDTAGSVRIIKDQNLVKAGAIAGKKAAEINGLEIIREGIEDIPHNCTRFFILSETDSPPSGKDKTSIIFSIKHTPSSLFNALREFAVRKINLTKIESRPTKRRPWEYDFYLDFEGHKGDKKCQIALRNLEEKSIFVKVLGSYPKSQ
ncbi:MAG: prephenate dehydratase [Candidatus Hodarchaeota archaeon]